MNEFEMFGAVDLFADFFGSGNNAEELKKEDPKPLEDEVKSSENLPQTSEEADGEEVVTDDTDAGFINEGFIMPDSNPETTGSDDGDDCPWPQDDNVSEDADSEEEDADNDDDDNEVSSSEAVSITASKSQSPTKAPEKPFITKEEIEALKPYPDKLKAKAIERLKTWLSEKEALKLDAAISDVKEAQKPDSSWSIHKKIQQDYNQNILFIAGMIPHIEENEALAADVLHPNKSLSNLVGFVSSKARDAATQKGKEFGASGSAGSAVIDSDTVYEWALDYFYQDEDKLEAERKAKEAERKAKSSSTASKKKPAPKKEENQISLMDFFKED